MPRNVRNFWIELSVDGKKTRVATGPRRADGGFELTIKMRDCTVSGSIVPALIVNGYADATGGLLLVAETPDGVRRIEHETKRHTKPFSGFIRR